MKDVQKWGDYPTPPSPAVLHKHSSDLEHRLEGGKVLQHTKFNHHQYRSLTWSLPTQQCQSFVIQALQFVLSICWGGGGGLEEGSIWIISTGFCQVQRRELEYYPLYNFLCACADPEWDRVRRVNATGPIHGNETQNVGMANNLLCRGWCHKTCIMRKFNR